MPRKKIDDKDKKVGFGVTFHPEIHKLLESEAKKLKISKSKLIEDIMVEYLKNNDNE